MENPSVVKKLIEYYTVIANTYVCVKFQQTRLQKHGSKFNHKILPRQAKIQVKKNACKNLRQNGNQSENYQSGLNSE